MSTGTLQLADLAVRMRTGRSSRWIEVIRNPRSAPAQVFRAVMDTSSADSLVTDSAAASTAWGIGELVHNDRIGLTPDGRFPTPILVHAQQSGRATGLVTTTRLSHATPAGFIANCPGTRDDEDGIAAQMLERKPDLLLGGGGVFFTHERLAAWGDLAVVRTRDELAAHRPKSERPRLAGIFAEQHMAFEMDRPAAQPSLAEMTEFALRFLESRSAALGGSGFLVQIEGGRVDHAAHRNDAGSLLRDQIAFDEAIGAALDFAAGRDDTLIVITTDHGNANPGLTDYGSAGAEGFEKLLAARRSFEWIEAQLAAMDSPPSAERIGSLIEEATAIGLESAEVDVLSRWLRGQAVDPFRIANKTLGPIGSVLANHTKVAFLSTNHTADYVEVTAIGPRAGLLPPFLNMAQMHGFIVSALDLPPARPI